MELTQRLTLYDLLSMVFPGCFILWSAMAFVKIKGCVIELSYLTNHDLLYYTAFFILAYLIGISWNTLNGWLWREFVISIAESSIKKELSKKKEIFFKYWNALSEDGVIEQYKCAYAYVRKNDVNSTISVVESQISMLSNMAFPLALWGGATMYINHVNMCLCLLGGILLSLFVFSIALLRQIRLYHLVCVIFLHLKRAEATTQTPKDEK